MSTRLGRGPLRVAPSLLLCLALAAAACGGGGTETGSTGDTTTASAGATTDPVSTAASGATTVAPATEPSRPHATTTALPTTTTESTATTSPTTTSPASPTTTTTVAPAVDLAACAAGLALRDRIALLVWPAVYSQDWDSSVQIVAEHQVGGVILMEPSGWGPEDLTRELARLDESVARGLVIATDEEGGAVQRLALLRPLASQQDVSESLSVDGARTLVAAHAELVAAAGVDMALGPVVDVVPASGEVPLTRTRFFTGDAARVADYAAAYVEAWRSAGLTPVVKHFPGHGAASGDTHDEEGVTPSLADLETTDLVPFHRLADSGAAVMVGHLTVPGLTDGLPATQSERAIRYLRDDLGYGDALVLSDALGMQAVGLPEPEAAVRALVVGIDVVIFTATAQTGPVIAAIEGAVAAGELTEDRITRSAARVLRELDPQRTGCGDG